MKEYFGNRNPVGKDGKNMDSQEYFSAWLPVLTCVNLSFSALMALWRILFPCQSILLTLYFYQISLITVFSKLGKM